MSLIVNGTTIKTISCNNITLNKVMFNNTQVYSGRQILPKISSYISGSYIYIQNAFVIDNKIYLFVSCSGTSNNFYVFTFNGNTWSSSRFTDRNFNSFSVYDAGVNYQQQLFILDNKICKLSYNDVTNVAEIQQYNTSNNTFTDTGILVNTQQQQQNTYHRIGIQYNNILYLLWGYNVKNTSSNITYNTQRYILDKYIYSNNRYTYSSSTSIAQFSGDASMYSYYNYYYTASSNAEYIEINKKPYIYLHGNIQKSKGGEYREHCLIVDLGNPTYLNITYNSSEIKQISSYFSVTRPIKTYLNYDCQGQYYRSSASSLLTNPSTFDNYDDHNMTSDKIAYVIYNDQLILFTFKYSSGGGYVQIDQYDGNTWITST